MTAPYRLKRMFERGGGVLWPANDAARERFDAVRGEDRLPLWNATRSRRDALSAWHDTALNGEDPPDPGPETEADEAPFEAAAGDALKATRADLGPDDEVGYRRP